MRGARITIRCDCGAVQYVEYGERWECEQCGRRWNTAQIPAEEYWGIMREMRRYRLQVIAVMLAVVALFAPLGFLVSPFFLVLGGVVLAFGYFWFTPYWRRKMHRRAQDLPKWNLHPE